MLLIWLYSHPPSNTAPLLTPPIPPLIFKSQICFSWLYMTPFTTVFQYCRFLPVLRAVLGGRLFLKLSLYCSKDELCYNS